MSSANALSRRWMSLGVVLVGLVLIPACAGGEKPKADSPRAAELVDAIANRNKPPKLVPWPRRDPPCPSEVALFPEDHDWKEEERTRTAIEQLEKDQTEAVWEEMVKRIGDPRYSETVTSVKTGTARIVDVGSICASLAYSGLTRVFKQHLPLIVGKEGAEVTLRLEILIGDLSRWRKQRAAKSLYELQIEACEMAIQALANVRDVTQAQKELARKKIEAEIAKLTKTKRPVLFGSSTLYYLERGRYDPELAKRVREAVKSGKYEDLDLPE
jgi:hypothetical protein